MTSEITYDLDAPNRGEEKLVKELNVQAEVAKEILSKQETDRIKKVLSNPSAVALTTAIPESGLELTGVKKPVKNLFQLYLTNQFVARAVNVRADTLVSRGYKIVGADDTGVKVCHDLIENSGGINLFRQLSINTDISGDGFLEKVYNTAKTKILKLKHVHPLTLSFKKHAKDTNKIIIDSKTKEPVGFTQKTIDHDGKELEKDIPRDRISHLRFNTLGDEFTGVSTIQPGYDTIVRLMNMEYAAAEAAVKTANPIIVGTTNTRSPNQVALWGQVLGRINGREQVFVPEGMTLNMLSPGPQNFSDYSEYFLNAVVAAFGVPSSILLGESSHGNRAESVVLSRHFYSVVRGNQKYMEEFFNEIFKEYAKLHGFEPPVLVFNDLATDMHLNSKTAIELFTSGLITKEEARKMIGVDDIFTDISTGSTDMKDSDMETWHNHEGNVPGSQAGVKDAQRSDPNSSVSPFSD